MGKSQFCCHTPNPPSFWRKTPPDIMLRAEDEKREHKPSPLYCDCRPERRGQDDACPRVPAQGCEGRAFCKRGSDRGRAFAIAPGKRGNCGGPPLLDRT